MTGKNSIDVYDITGLTPARIKTCTWCGKQYNGRIRRGETCSTPCATAKRRASRTRIVFCSLCGTPFEANSPRADVCPAEHYGNCIVCNKEFVIADAHRPSETCSSSCASVLSHSKEAEETRRKNNLKKYGVESVFQANAIKEKIKKTLDEHPKKDFRLGTENQKKLIKDKYGVDNVSSLSSTREKIKATLEERYSVSNPVFIPGVQKRIRETNIERYGIPYPFLSQESQDKARRSIIEHYGTPRPMSSQIWWDNIYKQFDGQYPMQDPDVAKKAKETNMSRYGVPSTLMDEETKRKIRATNKERYGAENPFASKEVMDRARETMMSRYGVENPSYSKELKQKRSETLERHLADGTVPKSASRISKLNLRMKSLFEEKGYHVDLEPSIGNGMNADMRLSYHGRSVVIDLNPTITHNMDIPYSCVINGCDQPCEQHHPIERNYHLLRAKSASENLHEPYMQFYEWNSTDDILSMVSNRLDDASMFLSARKCTIVRPSIEETDDFLKKTHIQTTVKGQSVRLGLSYDGNLVAVATFGAPRFNKAYQWEWLRYAVSDGIIIRGGSHRLLKEFIETVNPESIISYVDYNHTTGDSFFSSNGFAERKPSGASIMWSKPGTGKCVSNNSMVRIGADPLIGTHYGSMEESGMTNNDIMHAEGWLRVPTAGNRVFVWNQK